MIASMPRTDVANPDHFARLGVAATAETAARTRGEFAAWLWRFFELDRGRASDLVLVTSEALANCAEFAYVASEGAGTMDLEAWHDPDDATITVVVADR